MSSRTEKFQRKPRDPSQPQEKKSDEKVKASNPEAAAPVLAPVPTPTTNRQPPTEEESEKEEEQQLRFPPDEEAVRISLCPSSSMLKKQANVIRAQHIANIPLFPHSPSSKSHTSKKPKQTPYSPPPHSKRPSPPTSSPYPHVPTTCPTRSRF
jgi:hypothetical protein